MKKAIYSLIVLSLIFSFTACGGSDNSADQSGQEQEQTLEFVLPDEERNTTDMVDAIIYLAKDNAETATDSDLETAISFINDTYPDYFSDNDLMEKIIYYGSLIEYKYKGVDEDMQALGFYAATSVKYVYRNIDAVDSDDTVYNLGQLKSRLDKLNGIEPQKLSDEQRQAVLDFDAVLWNIVSESETVYNELSSTLSDYTAGNATLSDLKSAAQISGGAQDKLLELIPSGDENSQKYVDAVKDYVSNSGKIAWSLAGFIQTENQAFMDESTERIEKVPSYVFPIVSERISYLSNSGISDDEIVEISSPNT